MEFGVMPNPHGPNYDMYKSVHIWMRWRRCVQDCLVRKISCDPVSRSQFRAPNYSRWKGFSITIHFPNLIISKWYLYVHLKVIVVKVDLSPHSDGRIKYVVYNHDNATLMSIITWQQQILKVFVHIFLKYAQLQHWWKWPTYSMKTHIQLVLLVLCTYMFIQNITSSHVFLPKIFSHDPMV